MFPRAEEGEVSDADEELLCKPVCVDLPVWYPEQVAQAPLAALPVDLERECFGTSSWHLVEMDAGRVSIYSSFDGRIWKHQALVMGPGICVLAFYSQQGR